MRESFVKKSANSFFENKRASVLNEISNTGGQKIAKGMPVIIIGKNHVDKTTLDVYFGNTVILGVNPNDLELVKETDNFQPIESDTLDIRGHKFY